MSFDPHRPPGHALQRVALFAPGIGENLPASHFLHAPFSLVSAGTTPYDPALQNVHDTAATFS
jgi:hypothetical protein